MMVVINKGELFKTTLSLFILINGMSNIVSAQTPPVAGPGLNTSRVAPLAAGIQQNWSPTIDYRGVVVDRYQPNTMRVVGIYKVAGNPYLFGRPVKSNVFSIDGVGYNVMTAYDTYEQRLEIFQGPIDVDKVLLKNVNEIDSFSLRKDSVKRTDVTFINSRLLGDNKGIFLEKLMSGPNFSLYKEYKAELESNAIESQRGEVKEFVIKNYYYYTTSGKQKVKKIKPTASALKKEFPGNANIIPILDAGDLNTDTENVLVRVFLKLNDL